MPSPKFGFRTREERDTANAQAAAASPGTALEGVRHFFLATLRDRERFVLPFNPITMHAPRWVLEGYATVVEGRLTGAGRPTSTPPSGSGAIWHASSYATSGAHSMLIVGYNRSPAYFIIKNSWGTDFGHAGYAYVTYEYMQTYAKYGYVVKSVYVDTPQRASAHVPAPTIGVSPMRPHRLLVMPPVEVAAATLPEASSATAPTVPNFFSSMAPSIFPTECLSAWSSCTTSSCRARTRIASDSAIKGGTITPMGMRKSLRAEAIKAEAPLAFLMNNGFPPTARNARTGEFTPPGINCFAFSKRLLLREVSFMNRLFYSLCFSGNQAE